MSRMITTTLTIILLLATASAPTLARSNREQLGKPAPTSTVCEDVDAPLQPTRPHAGLGDGTVGPTFPRACRQIAAIDVSLGATRAAS